MAALRVRDVDLLHGKLQVRRAMSNTSAGWFVTAPKSSRYRRDAPVLHERVLAELRSYVLTHPRADAPDAALLPGKVPGHRTLSYDYAFDPKGFYRYQFRPAATRAGLGDLKLHERRHTAATVWLQNGISMLDVSRLLGHAKLLDHGPGARPRPEAGLVRQAAAHLRRGQQDQDRAVVAAGRQLAITRRTSREGIESRAEPQTDLLRRPAIRDQARR